MYLQSACSDTKTEMLEKIYVHLLMSLVKRGSSPELMPSTCPLNFYRSIVRCTACFAFSNTQSSQTEEEWKRSNVLECKRRKSSLLNSTTKAQRISWKQDSYLMHIPKPSLLLSAVSTNAVEFVYP